MTIADIMSYLLSRCVAGLPASELAEVFDKLIWCMDDNGREIEAVRREWLLSDDKRRVEVALSMSETFPFESRIEIENCFERITDKWPDLDVFCSNILASWDKQFLIE